MASARYLHSGTDDDRGEVQSAINKAMQAWIKNNPEDEDDLTPSRPKHRKISYGRSGPGSAGAGARGAAGYGAGTGARGSSAAVESSYFAEDGSMRCNLCSMSGLTKDELRQHINSVHTGGYAHYCTLCTKRFRFRTTYEQHMMVDHVGMAEDATFDRRTGHGFDKLQPPVNDTPAESPPVDQAQSMEVVLEEEVVTQPLVEAVVPESVAQQPAGELQGAAEIPEDVQILPLVEEVPSTVNGDISHAQQQTYEEIVRKPMPDIPKVQRRIDPVEQSVHISPTLQAPKRRINYSYIRSPAKQIRQDVDESKTLKFHCNRCPGVEFLDREGLTQHLNTYHTGEDRYKCKFCTRRFLIKANYENHLELDHGRDKFGRELPKKQVQPKPVAHRTVLTKKPTIRVGTSKQVILTDSLHDPSIDVIIDTETDDRRQAEDKIQKAYQNWKNNRETTGEKQRTCVCPICNVTMANKYKLDKHMQGHANPKKNMPKVRKCYHCDRVFQEGLQLERHVDAYHTHRCPKCDRVFNNLGDRDLHLVVAHAKKKGGRKSEIREETPPPPELEPEVPLKVTKTPKQYKTPSKVQPSSKSAQKSSSARKRPASPEPKRKMTPTKIKVQLVTKKKGRPKKVVAVKGKSSKKVAQPVKKGRPTKKAAAPKKKAAPAPAKKVAKSVAAKKSSPKGKGKASSSKSAISKKSPPKKATPKKTLQKGRSSKKVSPKTKTPPKKSAAKTPAKNKGKQLQRSDSLERKSPRKPHPKSMPEGFVMTGSEWKVGLKVKDDKKVKATSKSTQRKNPAAQKRTEVKKTASKRVVSKKVKTGSRSKGQKVQPKKAQIVSKKKVAKSAKSKATPTKATQTKSKAAPSISKAATPAAKKSQKSSTAVSAAVPARKSQSGKQVYKVEGKSAVWEYFGFYMSGSQYLKDVVICLLCGEEKVYSSDGSTSSMRGHIQHQHSAIWSKKFSTPAKKSGKKK